MKIYLLSLKEGPFKAMLDGTKKHEFRRRFFKGNENFLCAIYISAPIKAITGIAEFAPALKGDVDALVALAAGYNYPFTDNIRTYFEGLKEGYALPVVSIKTIPKIVPLARIRQLIPGFVAPQSYYSLDNPKYELIRKIVTENGS